MAYGVVKIYISEDRYPDLYAWLDDMSHKAKRLKNASLFIVRNNFTAHGKDSLTANEQEVQDEIALMYETYPSAGKVKSVISYGLLDKILRATKNPDYFSGLPMQSAEAVARQACADFTNWLKALKKWKTNPELFLGKPRMPGYIKGDKAQVPFTNQDCKIRNGRLCMPGKRSVAIAAVPDKAVLKEVKGSPAGDDYVLFVTYETPDSVPIPGSMPFTAAIDFGLNNLAAVVTDADTPCLIYKGGAAKAKNQWFNKERARLQSALMIGKSPDEYPGETHALRALSQDRERFLFDFFHKIGKHLVEWCMENGISRLIVGSNKLWKQECSIGSVNAQNFVQMPFYTFKKILKYLCERAGILFVEQEESYTSKASAADGDDIPVYRSNSNEKLSFSGKRIKRGLYRTKDGYLLNADLNGATNIGRKATSDFLKETDIVKKLSEIQVLRYGDFYKTSPSKNKKKAKSKGKAKSKRLIPAIVAA